MLSFFTQIYDNIIQPDLTDLLCCAMVCSSLNRCGGDFWNGFSVPNMDTQTALDKYIIKCRSENINEHTIKAKIRLISPFCVWCQKLIKDITIDELFKWLEIECKGKSPEVTFRIKTHLRQLFKYLSEVGESKVPYSLIKIRRPEHKPTNALTYDEFILLNKLCLSKKGNRRYIRWHALINMMFFSGCRRSEVLNIKVEDLDLINKTVRIKTAKTYKYSIRFFDFDIEPYLKAYKPTQKLFDLSGNAMSNMIVELTKELGIKRHISCHSFRAGLITYLHLKGWDIVDIARYVDHEDISTTQRYIDHNRAFILNKAKKTFSEKEYVNTKADIGKISIKTQIIYRK